VEIRYITIGNDGDFQDRRFVDIINNDLANTIGNLLNRTSSMSRKWFDNKVPNIEKKSSENKLENFAKITVENYINNFENYKLDLAATEVLNLAINTNLYLNDNQPWMLIKKQENLPIVKEIIYNVLESTRIIGLLLLPLLPELSSKINIQLGSLYQKEIPWEHQLKWGLLISNSSLPQPTPIINKLEYE
jgi:Methionyl-tRNA synthetase